MARKSLHHYKSTQNGTLDSVSSHGLLSADRTQPQDALRAFFLPIKTDDPRVDFYTMYKRDSAEYDVDYVKKYDEDLNTTLIYVCYSSSYPANHLIYSCMPACPLLSAPPSSSTSIQTSNPIPTNNPAVITSDHRQLDTHCSIDKVNGMVETNRPALKNAQYDTVAKQGDLLLRISWPPGVICCRAFC